MRRAAASLSIAKTGLVLDGEEHRLQWFTKSVYWFLCICRYDEVGDDRAMDLIFPYLEAEAW